MALIKCPGRIRSGTELRCGGKGRSGSSLASAAPARRQLTPAPRTLDSLPDVHVRRYVAAVVGHPVSDVQTLSLLEDATAQDGVPLRDVDTTIWEHSARRGRQQATA